MFSSSKIKLIRCLNILKLSEMFSPTQSIVGYLAIVYGNSRRRLNYASVVRGASQPTKLSGPHVGPTRVCWAELGHGVAVGQLRG